MVLPYYTVKSRRRQSNSAFLAGVVIQGEDETVLPARLRIEKHAVAHVNEPGQRLSHVLGIEGVVQVQVGRIAGRGFQNFRINLEMLRNFSGQFQKEFARFLLFGNGDVFFLLEAAMEVFLRDSSACMGTTISAPSSSSSRR